MENIVLVAVGILLIVLGYLIYFHQKINLVHSYHFKRVSDENKPSFCKGVGYGNIKIGAGFIVFPLVRLLANDTFAMCFLFAFVLSGMALIIYTIIKYNKGLF